MFTPIFDNDNHSHLVAHPTSNSVQFFAFQTLYPPLYSPTNSQQISTPFPTSFQLNLTNPLPISPPLSPLFPYYYQSIFYRKDINSIIFTSPVFILYFRHFINVRILPYLRQYLYDKHLSKNINIDLKTIKVYNRDNERKKITFLNLYFYKKLPIHIL